MILGLLNEACIETEKLIKDGFPVYKVTQNFVAPDKFLSQIQEAIDTIKKFITDDDLKKRTSRRWIPKSKKNCPK